MKAGMKAGLCAGTTGILALSAFERVERRLLGRSQVYAPEHVARRLAARAGVALDAHASARWGRRLRWAYGLAWGGLCVQVGGRWLARSPLVAGLGCGFLVWIFERAALPASGATPPFARWPRLDRALLVLHTASFGLGVAGGLRYVDGR